MLMPFLEGPERSVDFSCYEGHLLGTVTRVKAKTSQMLFHDSYGEELAGLIAQTFKLTGVLNLQTIEDASGTQRLMEVNTRASGGIGMTGLTNVNLPALCLMHWMAPYRIVRHGSLERYVRGDANCSGGLSERPIICDRRSSEIPSRTVCPEPYGHCGK